MSSWWPIEFDTRERVMAVSVEGQTVFNVDFPIQFAGDVVVEKRAVEADTFTEIELGTDYTISNAGLSSGFTLTLVTPATIGEAYRARGRALIARKQSVVRNGRFSSLALDLDLTRFTIICQEFLRDILDYAASTLRLADNGHWNGAEKRLENIADPAAAQDAVTRAYGDANYGGAAVSAAQEAAEAAAGSETNASNAADDAAAMAEAAAAHAASIDPTALVRRDGTQGVQADLPMGGNKLTELADGEADDDALAVGQVKGLHGLTIAQGDLLYGSGADDLARLAKGAAGQVLKMNAGATAPEWGAGGSLVYLGNASAANAASLSFQNGVNGIVIDDTYDVYKIILSDFSPVVDSQYLFARFGADGVLETAANYDYNFQDGSSGYSAGASAMYVSAGVQANYSNEALNAEITLLNFGRNNARSTMIATSSYFTSDGSMRRNIGAHQLRNNNVHNRFDLFYSSGNINHGTAYLYGMRKS